MEFQACAQCLIIGNSFCYTTCTFGKESFKVIRFILSSKLAKVTYLIIKAKFRQEFKAELNVES